MFRFCFLALSSQEPTPHIALHAAQRKHALSPLIFHGCVSAVTPPFHLLLPWPVETLTNRIQLNPHAKTTAPQQSLLPRCFSAHHFEVSSISCKQKVFIPVHPEFAKRLPTQDSRVHPKNHSAIKLILHMKFYTTPTLSLSKSSTLRKRHRYSPKRTMSIPFGEKPNQQTMPPLPSATSRISDPTPSGFYPERIAIRLCPLLCGNHSFRPPMISGFKNKTALRSAKTAQTIHLSEPSLSSSTMKETATRPKLRRITP